MSAEDVDLTLPGLDGLVAHHVRLDGRPHPGDEDYDAYANLFNDVTFALLASLNGDQLRFSERRRLTDELWSLRYRKLDQGLQPLPRQLRNGPG